MSTGDPSEAGRLGDRSALTDAANVLVLSGAMGSDARASYLDQVVPRRLGHLLVVSYAAGPGTWLSEWERLAPAPEGVVLVGSDEREADRRGVTRVTQSPEDLTGIGITVSERLTEWDGEAGGSLFLFDSLTVLLQFVELKRAFRFLHVLTNRVKATDAVAHYHLDPGAHDAQTVATLSSLFDTVVTYEDGIWELSGSR